ncbi:ABC transporter substrate-binding protein [Paraliobacillus quinghaiensis]|uniref:ABC transporter substrate-binding protein n=1 Tax=Paraliobacillus quinghaiensis TaxID=470815 RepID=A0A917WXK5_9BACI|nr:extracellular solute-binding protein [Paraliobacillus quinghaiensis]GGM38788.1 ABC transporter substrate-binding protein [Paraliobacillus quinghaiensis]
MQMRQGIFILLLILIILATACGDQSIMNGQDDKSMNTNQKKEEIIIWHTFSEKETNIFENYIIPLFEKDFPMIEVTPVRQAYSEELKSAIIARASTNKPPDIVRMDIAWLPKFAQLQLLYPVSNFEDFKDIKNRLYEEPLASNLYKGKYYGVPLNTNTKVAIYNQKLIEKFGIEKLPELMKELIDIVEKNNLVIGIDDLSPWETYHYFHGLGGVLMNSSYSKAQGYLDSEQSIKAVKKLLELYKNGNLTPKLFDAPNTWEGVLDRTYFMIDEGPWFYSVNSQEKIDFINELTVSSPFPETDGKRAVLGGENLVISKGTKHLEASWTFVKWMTSEVPQTQLARTGLIPSNKQINLTSFKQFPYYQTYLNSLDDTIIRPPVAEWVEIREVYMRYFKLIFTESISVEEALSRAAIEIDELLEEKGR